MLLLIRAVMCRYRLVQIFWRPKCQRKWKWNENFCFIYQDHQKFYQNVQEIRTEHYLPIFDIEICTRWCSHFFWRKNLREVILNFFAKMLSGETLCKLFQIFPPKVLVYIWTNLSRHFFDYFMEIYLTN